MNKQILAIGLSMLTILALTGDSFAGGKKGIVNHRQENQVNRIQQGVGSGELTRREAHKLGQGERRINRYEQKAKADGEVTRKEFLKMQHMQNKQSRAIFRQKHDRQDRPEQSSSGGSSSGSN